MTIIEGNKGVYIMELTVKDVLKAQVVSEKNLDKTKNCGTCLHQGCRVEEEPCVKCIDSFMGIVFAPTHWITKL